MLPPLVSSFPFYFLLLPSSSAHLWHCCPLGLVFVIILGAAGRYQSPQDGYIRSMPSWALDLLLIALYSALNSNAQRWTDFLFFLTLPLSSGFFPENYILSILYPVSHDDNLGLSWPPTLPFVLLYIALAKPCRSIFFFSTAILLFSWGQVLPHLLDSCSYQEGDLVPNPDTSSISVQLHFHLRDNFKIHTWLSYHISLSVLQNTQKDIYKTTMSFNISNHFLKFFSL